MANLETVSLMNEDTEEYVVTYDIDTHDIVEWTWTGVEHPLWTSGIPIKGYTPEMAKGLMKSYLEERVWEPNYVASCVLLDAFGLKEYNIRDIARKTYGIMRFSSVTRWLWFHDQPKRTFKEICEISANNWAGLDERCALYNQSLHFMLGGNN